MFQSQGAGITFNQQLRSQLVLVSCVHGMKRYGKPVRCAGEHSVSTSQELLDFGTVAYVLVQDSSNPCACIPCGSASTTANSYSPGTCGPATVSCSEDAAGSGCYSSAEQICTCSSATTEPTSASEQAPIRSYATSFLQTGCPNPNPNTLGYWETLSATVAFADMYGYCNLNANGEASTVQSDVCCGTGQTCTPTCIQQFGDNCCAVPTLESIVLTYTSSGGPISLTQSVSGGSFVSSWYSYGPMSLSTTDESASIDVALSKSYNPSTVSISLGSTAEEASSNSPVYTGTVYIGTFTVISGVPTGKVSIALELNKQSTIVVTVTNPQSGLLPLN